MSYVSHAAFTFIFEARYVSSEKDAHDNGLRNFNCTALQRTSVIMLHSNFKLYRPQTEGDGLETVVLGGFTLLLRNANGGPSHLNTS